MQPRKGPAWANDAAQVESSLMGKAKQQPKAPVDVDMDAGDNPVHEEGLSDLDWMRQRMSKNVDTVEKAFEQSDDEDTPEKPVRRNILFIASS
jgi:multiple RNA-binding domain-containing protein 1